MCRRMTGINGNLRSLDIGTKRSRKANGCQCYSANNFRDVPSVYRLQSAPGTTTSELGPHACLQSIALERKQKPRAVYNIYLRYFFSRQVPRSTRILLIESGSRSVLEKLLPALPRIFGNVEIDIVTCYAGEPKHFNGTLFSIHKYGGPSGREQLFADLSVRDYRLTGILSTGEPIMTKWKWWLGAKLPSKIFVINENADFFWCDWGHLGNMRSFALSRAGLTGTAAVPAVARLIFLPFTATFLLAYAGAVHLRRRLRLT